MNVSSDEVMPEASHRGGHPWSRGRRRVVLAVLVGLLAYVAISVADGVTEAIGALERADVTWLLAALLQRPRRTSFWRRSSAA
jgi:hypothetical protein